MHCDDTPADADQLYKTKFSAPFFSIHYMFNSQFFSPRFQVIRIELQAHQEPGKMNAQCYN